MSELERGSEEIERELEEKRAELDETAQALENKISTEYLWEQTRSYVEEGMESTRDLVRRHPIPTALAAALLVGEVVRRSSSRFSTRDERAVHRVLNELVRRAEGGSEQARRAIERSARSAVSQGDGMLHGAERAVQLFVNELIRRAERGSERAKSALERSAHSVSPQRDGVLHGFEDLLHRGQRAIEREARAVQSLPPRELVLVTAVATVIGAAVGTLLARRR